MKKGSDVLDSLTNFERQDLICFSHLRWNFVFQRPQHLMRRFARKYRVTYWEEPVYTALRAPRLDLDLTPEGVAVAVPFLPIGSDEEEANRFQSELLHELVKTRAIAMPVLWYYTPMALPFSLRLRAATTIYDCMDELSAFKNAHPMLGAREHELLRRADLVFTGGYSLYESKRRHHAAVYAFPSSVDTVHFGAARGKIPEPADQIGIPHPRLGFFGVLDERLDHALVQQLAEARPDWQIIMVGPIVKIDPGEVPRRANIHYLGPKPYADLPAYIGGWDLALMPFATNESTRFISPTKTPEYLAAGRPVVSTCIADVERQYGKLGAVRIAHSVSEFIAAAESALAQPHHEWLGAVDQVLADMSWEKTWARMNALVDATRAVCPRTERSQRQTFETVSTFAPAAPAIPKAERIGFDFLIVGAGVAGCVLAERLAAGANKRVLLIDRRPHIGGNAHDRYDKAGILVHPYGPHIFHTNSERIFDYLSRFTAWRAYEHRVLAAVSGLLLPIPINRMTINGFFGARLSPEEASAFLASKVVAKEITRTSEDIVLSRVGRELYEAFFRNYTQKQWGLDPSELDKSVAGRVPVRTNDDDRYFEDQFQYMPLHGFTRMFENMVDNQNITLMLQADYRDLRYDISYDHLIFSGPIDEFFDYEYGKLPYRSLRFCHETLELSQFQPVAVINYPSAEVPYTRITEYKHLTGQSHPKTSLTFEFPSAAGEPYYPVPRPENALLYAKYEALADALPNTSFVGRLATYRYYNMDQVVGQALALYEKLCAGRNSKRGARPLASTERASGAEI
jgi:UDP-galactopyranose mutase